MRRALGGFTGLVLAVLYAPVVVLILFSFNSSKYSVSWTGFTLDWYRRLAADGQVHDALANTLVVALASTLLSTALGTMAALAARDSFRGKKLYATLVSLPVMIPDIVMALALLSLYLVVRAVFGVPLSLVTVILAHTTFNLAYVAIVVSARLQGMDRTVELAAQDLGATPLATFWKVTFPALLPGILSGAILAFTLSLDDFVITWFTMGPGNDTLPVLIYSKVRRGISPEMNALSAVMLAASLGLIVVSLKLSRVPAAGRVR